MLLAHILLPTLPSSQKVEGDDVDDIYNALYGDEDNKKESSSATKVVDDDDWPFALFGDDNYEED